MYARIFGRTTKLLPNFGNHLAPDAMHIFIDVFLVALIATLVPYVTAVHRDERRRLTIEQMEQKPHVANGNKI